VCFNYTILYYTILGIMILLGDCVRARARACVCVWGVSSLSACFIHQDNEWLLVIKCGTLQSGRKPSTWVFWNLWWRNIPWEMICIQIWKFTFGMCIRLLRYPNVWETRCIYTKEKQNCKIYCSMKHQSLKCRKFNNRIKLVTVERSNCLLIIFGTVYCCH
jgi:hypothetical protein